MVIAGSTKRVAFYCRVNHSDKDYGKYLEDVKKRVEERYGKVEWKLELFYEEASGADPDRKEFNRLIAEASAKKLDLVISVRAAMIARNWGQFMRFMEVCGNGNAEVLCLEATEDAAKIYQRIKRFKELYFGGGGEPCM